MPRVYSRPITGVLVSVALAGCQAPNYNPSTNIPFAAVGETSAMALKFTSAVTPRTDFADQSASVNEMGRMILHEQADWLIAHPEATVLLIAGAPGGDRDLAARRARAVEAVLIGHGIDQSRIRLSIDGNLGRNGDAELQNAVLSEVKAKIERREAALVLPSSARVTAIVGEPDTAPTAKPDPAPEAKPDSAPSEEPTAPKDKPKRANAGKGNGGEGADPGNSGAHNQAGDD